ncbi:MAG: hypothetical protein U1F66_03490 [bacterium]
MNRSWVLRAFAMMAALFLPAMALAQTAKPLLVAKVAYGPDGVGKVSYDTKGITGQDVDSNKIQSTLVFYALAMNRLDLDSGKALINQVQAAVSKVATEQGMVRADIVKGNPLLKPLLDAPAEQSIELTFSEQPGKGVALEVKPEGFDAKFLAPTTLYLIQDNIKTLSESGLRLMVLAMGGMNKWYREVGKASDPDSVSKAPSYALNLAVDIVEKLGGKKKN